MKLVEEINNRYGYDINVSELDIEDGCGYKEEADYIIYVLFKGHDLYEDIVMELKEKLDVIDGVRACQLFSEEMVEEKECEAMYFDVLHVLIEMIELYS
jgi:hypothetical protein